MTLIFASKATVPGGRFDALSPRLPVFPGVLDYARQGMFSGANERNAIFVLRAYLDAQSKYASLDRNGDDYKKNRDKMLAAIAAAITMLARMAFFFGGNRDEENRGGAMSMLFMLILAPIAAMLIQMAISRTREFAADRRGAVLSGHPLWLASALRARMADAAFWSLVAALDAPAPLDLRVNVLKTRREAARAALAAAGIESLPTPYSPWGLRVAGKPAVVDVPKGKGHYLLFAINPMWRQQTQGSYMLLLNAAMNFGALGVGRPAEAAKPAATADDDDWQQ